MLEICQRISQLARGHQDATLSTGVAWAKEDIFAACRLVYESYTDAGLLKENSCRLRILRHQLLPESWIVFTKQDRAVVGTATLVTDGPAGLPADKLYQNELDKLRPLRLAELACFATRASRESKSFVHAVLSRTFQLAASQNVQYIVACCHPRHANFYRQRLRADTLGELRQCSWAGDRPAELVGFAVR